MRSLLSAAALSIAAHAAMAQPVCAPVQGPALPAAGAAPSAKAHGAQPASVHGELIKTAAAGTREVPARPAAPRPQEDKPQRGSAAMLLAALALMSGIALRRWGGPRA